MYTDSLGLAPEAWQWAVSGAMFLGGIILTATGVGGVLGGALICAGANSIISSYISEMSGGSATAGWVGGLITGISGIGAGLAGNLFLSATEATGAACLGKVVASGATAVAFGTGASVAGEVASAKIDNRKPNKNIMAKSAAANSSITLLGGIGSEIGSAIYNMPLISTTTKAVSGFLSATWSLITEAVSDVLGLFLLFWDKSLFFRRLI